MHSKRSIAIEIIVSLLFFQFFNVLGWRESPGFYGFEPHPYFIVVLLFACRYGTFAGMLSALLSTAFLIGISHHFLEKYPDDPFIVKQTILFLIAGGITGEIRQMYIKKYESLKADFEREQYKANNIIEESKMVKKVNSELEKRVLDSVSTFTALYETSKQLQSFNIEQIYTAILQLLNRHLNAEKSSLYLLEGDEVVLKESTISEGHPLERVNFLFEDGMIVRTIKDKKVYSIRDFIDKQAPDIIRPGQPLMAAPLIKTDGSIIGALSIEDMPFFHITASSVKIFGLLADWVSKDIENALYYQDAKEKNILDEILNVYTINYFNHRLAQEFDRARRYGLPLSIILIRMKNFNTMKDQAQLKILKFLASCLNTTFRFTDIVSRYNDDIPFALILTTTKYDQSLLAIRRLLTTLDSLGIKTMNNGQEIELEFGISTHESTMNDPSEMVEQAKEQLAQWNQNALISEQL